MRKSMKKINIPFWIQILIILLIGVVASIIVLIVINKFGGLKNDLPEYTVTFAYSDGTVIEKKTVEEGKGVFPPEIEKTGVFRGWSAGFNSVRSDIEVHPVFHNISEENLFYFDSVYVKEGKKFTLDVYVDGKVSISSGMLLLSYDPEVLEYKKSKGLDSLNITEDTIGELVISFNCNTPVDERTLISQLTFYAKKKDVYATRIDLTAKETKVIVDGTESSANCATINNKIYFLQEVNQ